MTIYVVYLSESYEEETFPQSFHRTMEGARAAAEKSAASFPDMREVDICYWSNSSTFVYVHPEKLEE